MKRKQIIDYIAHFREKAEMQKLIIFVGSGVSCNVEGMPSWYSLIRSMAHAIGYSKCDGCKHKTDDCKETCGFIEDYSSDEFLKIPQYVYNSSKELYDRVLKESLPNVTNDAPLSSAIFDINPVHIITTNYDSLLESSQNVFREQYEVIVRDGDLLTSEKSKYIIKMHGDLTDPDTIVLKEQDYLNYSQKHILIELFVKSLLTDHTIIFLGYSLNDYNIKLIVSWLNYMRLKNDATTARPSIGYIIQDADAVDDTQAAYFAGNSIEVLNIREIPCISDVPESLSDDRGKRLYSFLKIIADPSLDDGLASIEEAVRFMSSYSFVDYSNMLNLLHIKQYEKSDTSLRVFLQRDYDRLTRFLTSDSIEAPTLKQLFIDTGILDIYLSDSKKYHIGDWSGNTLVFNEPFNLYFQNKYDQLYESIIDKGTDPIIKCFYRSIINGYDDMMLDEYNRIDFPTLSLHHKVAYLHNAAVLDMLAGHGNFVSKKVTQFIENIPSFRDRNMFSFYQDIYNGNSEKRLNMNLALAKLSDDVVNKSRIHISKTSHPELNKIKNYVLVHYFSHFHNAIFYEGFRDIKSFFKPYIEAVMCANSEQAEASSSLFGFNVAKEKYPLEYIDCDIITKFISTKDLAHLISSYKMRRLNANVDIISFMVTCFVNMSKSIVEKQTYGYRHSAFMVLSNLALLLKLVVLDEQHQKSLAASIESLFCDKRIVQIFFSIYCPDFGNTLIAMSNLCASLHFSLNTKILRNIFFHEKFFEYAINVNFNKLRKLILSFVPESSVDDCQNELVEIIEAARSFRQKIILLRLLFKRIVDANIRENYISLLSENFSRLDVPAIYDFTFNGWIRIEPAESCAFMNSIIEDYEKRKETGIHSFPDPVETKLECVYLLFINDIITNIDPLWKLKDEHPHLQFLLEPNTFDYSKVDFDNYMWGNFARHPKYMEKFVEHKKEITPRIKERIQNDSASDMEKKIFYGYLLEKEDFWK